MSHSAAMVRTFVSRVFHLESVGVLGPMLNLAQPRELVLSRLDCAIPRARLSNFNHSLCAGMGVTGIVAEML